MQPPEPQRTFRCVECGGTVRPVAKAGRTMSYKRVVLPVPDDLVLRTCDGCGEEYFNGAEAIATDAAMEKVWQAHVDLVAKKSVVVEDLEGATEPVLFTIKHDQPHTAVVSRLTTAGVVVTEIDLTPKE